MRSVVSIVLVIVLAVCSVMTMAGVATAATGSISGYVHEEGGTTPVTGATVYAYDWSVDLTVGMADPMGSGYVDSDGSYTISAVSSGDYRVVAVMDGYFSEYYNNVASPGAATPVSVADSNATAGINFTLAVGGSISGAVYKEGVGTPIHPARVIVYNSITGLMVDDGWTTDNGSYTVGNNIAPGSYWVKAEADGYFSKYHDNVTDSASALPVTVTLPEGAAGISFWLTPGGSISGVVKTDNGTPIFGAWVTAYDNVTGQMVDDGWSGLDGSYTVGNNIDSGAYRVRADMDGYFSEYYNDAPDPASASLVTVTAPDPTAGIDFVLTEGGSITGLVQTDNGTAIYGARVMAFDNVTGALVDEAWSRPNGIYILGNNVYAGYYRIGVEADGYFTEYYDNVTDLASAIPVSVTPPTATPNINFTLSLQTLIISEVVDTVTGETTATITWTTGEPATSQVEYGLTDQYGTSSTEDPTPVTNHIVYLTGLTASTTYHYRVKSVDAENRQGRSGDYDFTTSDLTAPVISDVTAIDLTATGAAITWTTNELATSQVEYGLTASYGTTPDEDPTLVTNHIVILTGLTSGTTYHYLVKSRDATGHWGYSTDYTFATLDITAPVISAPSATGITETSATITWTTDEAATSEVEYGLTDQYGSATTLDSNVLTSHTVNLSGLTADTTYHYRVKSKDGSNNEAQSGDYTFTTAVAPVPDTTSPTTPAITDDGESTTSLTQLHATWTSSDPESGIVEYQYAIGTLAGGTDVVDWTSAGTATEVTRTGLDLSVGTAYYFSVKAQNGEGLWSDIGTSNGITAQEETSEEPSDDGGMPMWGWIIIGLGGAAILGGLGYWLIKGMPKQPQQQ